MAAALASMKILFLTYCYPPQKFPRSVQICHLVNQLRKDFSIEILTATPGNNLDLSLLEFCVKDNVNVVAKSRLTTVIEKMRGHRIKQAILPDEQYLWHRDVYNAAVAKIQHDQIEMIVTFGQPMSTHIAGLKLKRRFPQIKWLAHFSDPWVDNIFNTYNVWTKFINKCYQSQVFKAADQLLFTSPETIELVMQGYGDEIKNKTQYLPHSFDAALFKPIPRSNIFTIRYLGNFYGGRQPDVFLQALQVLKNDETNLRVELIGTNAKHIAPLIVQYDLEDMVFVLPAVNYLQSLELAVSSDLLLLIDAPTVQSPFFASKLVDYIGANRPIFGITPSGTAHRMLEEMGFLVANPTDTQEIANKLQKMIAAVRAAKCSEIPQHIRRLYTVETVGEQMRALIANLGR